MKLTRFAASLLIALPLLASCRSDESLKEPDVIDPMFRRYVSLGNSITAGFQSAGINDSTQSRSYAVLLAAAMQTPFTRPSLQGRGCVPPFTNNVTQARVGGGNASTCDLRATPTARPNNLAVPGARVEELLNNFGTPVSASNALTTFILGGKTQIERMQEAKPTFVTVWAGNNDVLGAFTNSSNPGNPALITPEAMFIAQYDSVLDAIEATGAKAALISVANVTNTPFASAGAIYYCLKNGGCPAPLPPQNPVLGSIPTFTVNVNCAPPGGLQVLVPWTVGLTKVSTAIAGTPASIDCTVDNEVVTPSELNGLITAITAFNNHIQAEATARGWAYVDINSPLAALRANGTIPPFPDVAGALVQPPTSVLFGPIFSLDGVHPSSTAHRLIADSVASAINAHYGTSLPVPVCGTVSCPAP
ncbi:MAG TPA: SGNH/GDSL hydrolase family protein [Gemmatimonadales bacterium]|nr:SGNH/GDSL hydrolase family protein [Gemmatimonadales bacterium]